MKTYLSLLLVAICNLCISQSKKHQIDSILKSIPGLGKGPGLTVGVVANGEKIYHGNQGWMNLEYGLSFNDSTVFGLASVTKQFTSACIAILERQGKLSIYDDIRDYIPELQFYGDTIQIRHLLNHSSGIRNHNVLLSLSGFDFTHQGYTNESIEQLMFKQRGVNNKPGDKMLYSNTNYVLLALLVKRVSGLPIHTFAERNLFEPLGMSNSFYFSDLNRVVSNRAYGYYPSREGFKQKRSVTLCVGAGGMATTMNDMAKWSRVFLDPSHKFAYLAKFISELDTLNNGAPMKHARGMFVSEYKGVKTINHSGRDVGMRSQFICVPKLNLAIVVYANSPQINAVEVSYQILDLWLPEVAILNMPSSKTPTYSTHKLHKFTGVYQEMNSDMRMVVTARNDTLYAQSSFGKFPVPLKAQSASVFSRIENSSVRYIFSEGSSPESDLMVDFGGAIFYLERITLNDKPNTNLSEFAGTYYSSELDVTYELVYNKNQLTLNYRNNEGLILTEGEKDVFGANRRTKYTFHRDKHNSIHSFVVASEGTVKGIVFQKQ